MTTNPSLKDRTQETASTAGDESRHVAGVAQDEARNVASTAADQARNLVDEARQQIGSRLGEQTGTQRDRLTGTLRTLSDDFERMAGEGDGLAGDLAHEVADRARALGEHLESREPSQLIGEVRDFARRRPGMFLLGALAAGVVAGRLFRGAADGAAAAELAPNDPTPTRADLGDLGDPLPVTPATSSGEAPTAGGPPPVMPPVNPPVTTGTITTDLP